MNNIYIYIIHMFAFTMVIVVKEALPQMYITYVWQDIFSKTIFHELTSTTSNAREYKTKIVDESSTLLVFVVVNFDALAQASDIQIERRQVVFLCWMQDLNPGSQTPNRQQTECSLTNDWAIEDQAKNLNSTARPLDQRAFNPLDPTVSWLSHLALAIYMFVVVNFDALAQASDIQIERRQVVFLCWMQDFNPGSQTPNRQQTECSLTNRLSYRGSS